MPHKQYPEQRCRKFGDQGGKANTIGFHAENQNEQGAQPHISEIEKYLDDKGNCRAALADEPTENAKICEREGSGPNAVAEINFTLRAHFRRTPDEAKRYVFDQGTYSNEKYARYGSDGQGAPQNSGQFNMIASTYGLRGKAPG